MDDRKERNKVEEEDDTQREEHITDKWGEVKRGGVKMTSTERRREETRWGGSW